MWVNPMLSIWLYGVIGFCVVCGIILGVSYSNKE